MLYLSAGHSSSSKMLHVRLVSLDPRWLSFSPPPFLLKKVPFKTIGGEKFLSSQGENSQEAPTRVGIAGHFNPGPKGNDPIGSPQEPRTHMRPFGKDNEEIQQPSTLYLTASLSLSLSIRV